MNFHSMIDIIHRIGKQISGGDLSLENFIRHICVPVAREGEDDRKVVILHFDTENDRIDVEVEDINAAGEDTSRKYVYIGEKIRHKLYTPLTTRKVGGLLTNFLFEIDKTLVKDKIDNEPIRTIIDRFFDDNGKIQVEKFSFFPVQVQKIRQEIPSLIHRLQELAENYQAKTFKEFIPELKKFWEEATGKTLKVKATAAGIPEVMEQLAALAENPERFLHEKYQDPEALIKDLLRSVHLDYLKKYPNTNSEIPTRSLQVALYSVKKDGEILAQQPFYKEFIYREKIENNFEKDKIPSGVCYVCGKEGIPVTGKFTNLQFKFYNADKLNFSSNLNKKFDRNFTICKDCYQYLMMGENYTNARLRTKIGDLPVLILPTMIFEDQFHIDRAAEVLQGRTKIMNNIKQLEGRLEDYIYYRDEDNLYNINYLFYYSSKNEFKVLKLIKDVPETRVTKILRTQNAIRDLVREKYANIAWYYIDFENIWHNFPVKEEKSGEYKEGLNLYFDILDAVFSGKPLRAQLITDAAVETARIIRFKRPGYNVSLNGDNVPPERIDAELVHKMMRTNFLLLFLRKLQVILPKNQRMSIMKKIKHLIPDDIFRFWDDIPAYDDDAKRGLFLLGYLIGEIGNKQYQTNKKSKPILDKINFQGMGLSQVKRLVPDVFEKLKQYDILRFNEGTFSAAKFLIDESLSDWPLSNQDNVFYLLSGYAYSNFRRIQQSGQEGEDENGQEEENN